MLGNMKIGQVLGVGFGAVILLSIAIGLVSMYRMSVLADLTTNLYDHPLQVSNAVHRATANILRIHRSMKDIAVTQDHAQIETALRDIESHQEEVYKDFAVVDRRFLGARELYEESLAAFAQWQVIRDEVIALKRAGEEEEAYGITGGKGARHVALIAQRMQTLTDFAHSKAEDFLADAEATRVRTFRDSCIVLAVVTGLGVGIFIFISRRITTRISEVARAARDIAAGDLPTIDVSANGGGDEIDLLKQSIGQMVGSLQEMTGTMAESANTQSATISEISAATALIASSTSETATAVGQTTTTVEELKQTIQVASERAEDVAGLARQAATTAEQGRESVAQVNQGMTQIQQHMAAVGESIVQLSEQSQAIGQIISTVDDLAEQSNLLAVNAAIEAAKAGDEGKSFGVVAEEIRNLAEQSKAGTARVRTILTDIQKATSAAVMAAEQSTKAVEAGVLQAGQAGEAIDALTSGVVEASGAAAQIAASGQQQLAGVDQVAAAMVNIRQASSQNAASMQQAEKAAANLNEVGAGMKQLVARYQLSA